MCDIRRCPLSININRIRSACAQISTTFSSKSEGGGDPTDIRRRRDLQDLVPRTLVFDSITVNCDRLCHVTGILAAMYNCTRPYSTILPRSLESLHRIITRATGRTRIPHYSGYTRFVTNRRISSGRKVGFACRVRFRGASTVT